MTDRTALLALAERVERLTGPDREVDALIHRAVTPELADTLTGGETGTPGTGWLVGGNLDWPTKAPEYTRSLDAALTLVAPQTAWHLSAGGNKGDPYGAGVFRWHGNHMAVGKNPAIAFCAAALRALAGDE
jgi:hypothetical protein